MTTKKTTKTMTKKKTTFEDGMKIEIQEVDDVSLAFGGNISKLMPAYKDIPEDFKSFYNPWVKIFSDWFYFGFKSAVFRPKPGIDKDKALRHIKAIMHSWQPKHEHKEAAVAFLLSEWFDGVDYEVAERKG